MHLSKACNCLPHGLMIAKLEAYGIGKPGLNSFLRYLSNRKQRAKVNSSYSCRSDIIRKLEAYRKDLFWAHCYAIFIYQ